MRAVIQRVRRAKVEVEGAVTGEIGAGLMVLLGVAKGDSADDVAYLTDKIINLRVFRDQDEKMNLSLLDTGGAILLVSNFTLLADVRKGRRPAFDQAAPPAEAKSLYEQFITSLRSFGLDVQTGVFQADMLLTLEGNGPVTIICESRPKL